MNLKNKRIFSPLIIFLVPSLLLFSLFLFLTFINKSSPGYSLFKIEDSDRYQFFSKKSEYAVIVFFDLNCEYCKDLHNQIKRNKENFTNINLILRNYPLLENGKSGYKVLVGECVASQEGTEVWLDYLDKSYINFNKNEDRIAAYFLGESLVKDRIKFEECTKSTALMEIISKERSINLIKGITYTPSLVVLKNNQVLKVYNGSGVRAGLEIIKYYNK